MTANDLMSTSRSAFKLVEDFGRKFGVEHVRLAMHAAVPLSLTPELLNLIRINFVVHADPIAETDVLLSPFCDEIGGELYELLPSVRQLLLEELLTDRDYGYTRVEEVCRFLHEYSRRILRHPDPLSPSVREFFIAQRWDAVARIHPEAAAKAFALEIDRGLRHPESDALVHIAALTEKLSMSMPSEARVLFYANAVSRMVSGDVQTAQEIFAALGVDEKPMQVQDIKLPSAVALRSALQKIVPSETAVSSFRTQQPRLFLSHTFADVDFAEKLYRDLVTNGFFVWWDRQSLPLRGNAFTDEIRAAVEASDRVVLIIGHDTSDSSSSRAEWEYALNQCLPVHVIRRSGDYVPNALINYELVDLRDDSETAYAAGLNLLLQQLSHELPVLGALYNVPSVPNVQANYLNVQQFDSYIRIKLELLQPESSIVQVASPIAITGAGGFGKTTIAAALCHDCEVRRGFRDGIFWLALGQSPDWLAQYAALGRMLGDDITAYSDETSARSRLKGLLENRRSMVVLDDVWSDSYVGEFLSALSNSAVLITTRNETVARQVEARNFIQEETATGPIYIIHATQDDVAVTRIAERLRAENIPIWTDHLDIRPSESFSEIIQDAVQNTRAALFVMSAHSVRSKECTAELRTILSLKKPLYIVQLERIPRDDIPYRLALTQYIDLVPDFDAGIQALIGILKQQQGAVDSPSRVPQRLTEYPLIDEELLGLRLAGRQNELGEAFTILGSRPLTILGIGGIGKSRLAAAIVTEGKWENVVWYQCSSLSTAKGVYDVVRQHYSLLPIASIEDVLASMKQTSGLLIVLDSADALDPAHQLEIYQLIETISGAGAAVCITSRVRLEVPRSSVMSLAALTSADATQMALNAAEFYDLPWDNRTEATEVANAARSHPRLIVWAVQQLKNHPVRRVIDDLLNLKSTDDQAQLAGMIRQRVQHLSESSLSALRALTVFRGEFTYNAATAVTHITDNELTELDEQHLIHWRRESNRFSVEDQVRNVVGEDGSVRRLHYDYYLALVREHDSRQDYAGLDLDLANIDAAFEWAISVDPESALWLATASADFQRNRGRFAQCVDWAVRVESALRSGNVALRANALNYLGLAYLNLASVEDRAGNLRRAISAYTEALRFRTPEEAPLDYALTQNHLGNAYHDLSNIEDRTDSLQRAISAYAEALRFRTPEAAPLDYALTQNNLGNAYQRLASVEDGAGNLRRALSSYTEAMRFYTPSSAPLNYASTQLGLGRGYMSLAQIEDRGANLRRAIEAYTNALVYFTPEVAPLDYARTQHDLGLAYAELAELEDRSANLRRAIGAYESALIYQTPDAAPNDYARTLNSSALAWQALGDVDRAEAAWREAERLYRQLGFVQEADGILDRLPKQKSTQQPPHIDSNTSIQLIDGRTLTWSRSPELVIYSGSGQALVTLIGHTAEVQGALALTDGRLLSWSTDRTLRLWSGSGQALAVLEGHTDWVTGALALADGRLLSWSTDHTLRLWSVDGASKAVMEGHTDWVNGAQALVDGRILSWSSDATLRLWAADGPALATLTGHTAPVNGALMLADGRILSWSSDATLRLWAADSSPLTILTGHTGRVNGALMLADGRLLSWGDDRAARLWSIDGVLLRTLTGHANSIASVVILPDGRIRTQDTSGAELMWSAIGDLIDDSLVSAAESQSETANTPDSDLSERTELDRLRRERDELNNELRRLSDEASQTYRPTTRTRLETERAKVEEKIREIDSDIRELQRRLPTHTQQERVIEGNPAIQLPKQFFFFSYAGTEGIDLAERIYRGLKSRSLPVWMTHKDLDALGSAGAVDDWLELVIKQATGIIFIVSRSTPNSSSATKDIPLAQEYNIPIVVVRADMSQIPTALSRFPVIDFSNGRNFRKSLEQLIPEAEQILGSVGRTDTPSPVLDQRSQVSKRIDIYISSTSRDLSDYRKAAQEALLSLGMSPIMMENFPASSEDPLNIPLDLVARSDIHILLVGKRYGYIPDDPRNPDQLSIVELEYNEAIRLDKPVFVFAMDDQQSIIVSAVETDPITIDKLRRFRSKLLAKHAVSFFTSPDDLASKIAQVLAGSQGQETRRTASRPLSVDLLPAPFAWIDIPVGKVGINGQTFAVAPFKIAKYPVTTAQFAKFVEGGGYHERRWWTDTGWAQRQNDRWTQPRYLQDSRWNGADQPVVGLSWFEAVAFCVWLSEISRERITLPTEQQWQRAAQGDDSRAYPWGNAWDGARCNTDVSGKSTGKTTPVRQYEGRGDSPFGVADMAGNLWEWCLTDYDTGSSEIASSGRRVIRGGSWAERNIQVFRCDYRSVQAPSKQSNTMGFRLVMI